MSKSNISSLYTIPLLDANEKMQCQMIFEVYICNAILLREARSWVQPLERPYDLEGGLQEDNSFGCIE